MSSSLIGRGKKMKNKKGNAFNAIVRQGKPPFCISPYSKKNVFVTFVCNFTNTNCLVEEHKVVHICVKQGEEYMPFSFYFNTI